MMSNNDIRIDTISGMTGREVHMRLVHIPTGKTAEGSGVSRLRLRDELYRELAGKVECNENNSNECCQIVN